MLLPLALALSTLGQLRQDARDNAALLDRIQAVETGGCKDPAHAVGDSGLALGYMQMHPDYYADCRKECPALPDYRAACQSREWSRLAVCSFWRKYKAKTDREKALAHHYGSNFRRIHDRHKYAAKCGV